MVTWERRREDGAQLPAQANLTGSTRHGVLHQGGLPWRVIFGSRLTGARVEGARQPGCAHDALRLEVDVEAQDVWTGMVPGRV
jgi:hypothetical protein